MHPKEKEVVRGAYDKDGRWWHESDIETYTGGMIELCFGKRRYHIRIVDK